MFRSRAPHALRSGGADAVSRDARNAPRHFGADEPLAAEAATSSSGALYGAPNERRMEGGIPEIAPRHSDGQAMPLEMQKEAVQ